MRSRLLRKGKGRLLAQHDELARVRPRFVRQRRVRRVELRRDGGECNGGLCKAFARDIVGADNVNDNVAPSMGGEDFGAMITDRPGAYVWVGQAEQDPNSNHNQGLHTPRYDFNDDIIPTVIEYFAQLVERSMPLAA